MSPGTPLIEVCETTGAEEVFTDVEVEVEELIELVAEETVVVVEVKTGDIVVSATVSSTHPNVEYVGLNVVLSSFSSSSSSSFFFFFAHQGASDSFSIDSSPSSTGACLRLAGVSVFPEV